MALGNQVRKTGAPPPLQVLPAKIAPAERESFWLRNRFRVPRTGGILGWTCRFLCRHGTDRQARCHFCSKRVSASDAMSVVTDRMRLGVEGGSETVEVAFQHVFFVSDPDGVCNTGNDPGLESRVAASLMSSLKGYYDPGLGVRIGCLVGETVESGDVNMVLGPGVFVPRAGERAVGWLRYYPVAREPENYVEPRLLDGRLAGIYKGQSGLAFGVGARLFPADLALGLDNESSLFIHMSKAIEGAEGEDINALIGVFGDRAVRPVIRVVPSRPEVDRTWQIDFAGANRPPGRLELCADARPSRLHYRKTQRCNAEIVKLRVELGAFGGTVDRFWFDFDHRNRLAASALQQVHSSVVWDERDQRDYVYNWTDSPSPFSAAGRIGMKVKRVDGAVEIARLDDQPLGFLELPQRSQQSIFADELQMLSGFHLDWLDDCARISIAGRVVPLGQAYAEIGGETRVVAFAGRRTGGDLPVVGPLVLAEVTAGSI